MDFRTQINPQPADWRIDHATSLLCLGSCFADRIGARLQSHKFPSLVNPFGVVFHPLPLLELLRLCLGTADELLEALDKTHFQREEEHGSFLLHSQWNEFSYAGLQDEVLLLRDEVQAFLATADAVVLTFGTAIGFHHKGMDQVVANCHRFPGGDFEQVVSEVDLLAEAGRQVLDLLLAFKPEINIVLTVSPVRHLRSGLVESSGSKARLRVLCDQLVAHHPQISYFPSYELMVDDLRGYRFYEKDMLHPNEVALDYIWDHFDGVYFDDETRLINQGVEEVQRSLQHRPRYQQGKSHQQFLNKLKAKIDLLGEKVNMEEERSALTELRRAAGLED